MTEYTQKASNRLRSTATSPRRAIRDATPSLEHQPPETELDILHAALNESPRVQALAQLQRTRNQRGRERTIALSGCAPVQRVNDEANQPVHVDWPNVTVELARAYQAKIANEGWTVTPEETAALAWIVAGRVPAAEPPTYPALAAAPPAAGSVPGGSFANYAPLPPAAAVRGKTGWTRATNPPPPPAAEVAIQAAFREMRIKRSVTKRIFEEERLKAPAGQAPGRPELFGTTEGTAHVPPNLTAPAGKRMSPAGLVAAMPGLGYAQLLDALQHEPDLLAQTAPFVAGTLTFGAAHRGGLIEVKFAGAVAGYLSIGAGATYSPPVLVPAAAAAVGPAAAPLVAAAPPPPPRPLFGKRGRPLKEYVKDNRGVVTRRYAYCEKNFWQFMDFLTNERMEGRFQMFSRAIGDAAPNLFANTEPATVMPAAAGPGAAPPAAAPPGPMTMEQLAVLHQWKGSGPEQRGLSLTSTRHGVVLGNAGESFKSAQGFLITIDLSRVPADVILVNHYAERGVRDDMGAVNARAYGAVNPGAGGPRYNYTGSAAKNRELYLEHLEPAWISDVRWHGAPVGVPAGLGQAGVHGGVAGWMGHMRATTGYAPFVAGFDAMVAVPGLGVIPAIPGGVGRNWIQAQIQGRGAITHGFAAPAPPAGASPFETLRFGQGVSMARHYLLGHFHGRLRVAVPGGAAAMDFTTVRAAAADVGDYNLAGGAMDHLPEAYYVGFGHGRSGQPVGVLAAPGAAFLERGRPVNLTSQPGGARALPAPGAPAGAPPKYQTDVADTAPEQPTEAALAALLA